MNDPVHNPSHYKSGGIEVIDVIEAFELNFRLANVIKYVLRAGRKDDALEDLEKAAWYLDREIDKLYEKAEAEEVATDKTHAKPIVCAEKPNIGDEMQAEKRESLDGEVSSMAQLCRDIDREIKAKEEEWQADSTLKAFGRFMPIDQREYDG